MWSFIRRTTAAGALTLSVGLGVGVPASAAVTGSAPQSSAPSAQPTAAQAGAGWLGRQFHGAFIGTKSTPDPGSTAEAVLAFAAAGAGGTKARAAITWLTKHFESYVSPGGVDDAGALATVILAAQVMGGRAAGVDPTAFGGRKAANDLVARLELTQRTSGSDAGLFGASDPSFDGAFRQGLSLMALVNQGLGGSAAVAAGVTWLQNQQCADGGWESYRSDLTTACPVPDPSTFSGPDTNSTALAVEGLVAAGGTFPTSPLAFFESSQNTDGGFGFIGAASQSPDPDSTGLVIQALVALGQQNNAAFTQTGGATPFTALATFQLGCSATKAQRGAYTFPGESGPNLLATLQAVPGAAGVAFPLTAQSIPPALPTLKCPAH
ncbi:MAG TPA: prenyltransferase/squalene oxidase repeat-containing protein [Acidimicrobiales bacterium]|nr:prenyltransferase/squalene oxidase repeat-containing protein [Acidimicrobiales bacterium]